MTSFGFNCSSIDLIANTMPTTAMISHRKKEEKPAFCVVDVFLDAGTRENRWNLVESDLQKLQTIVVVVPEVLPKCIVE